MDDKPTEGEPKLSKNSVSTENTEMEKEKDPKLKKVKKNSEDHFCDVKIEKRSKTVDDKKVLLCNFNSCNNFYHSSRGLHIHQARMHPSDYASENTVY